MAALPGGSNVTVNHSFVSGKADGADPTLVQPSAWNAAEVVAGGSDGQKTVRDSGQTKGSSWVNYDPASFTNNTGGAAAVGDVVAVSTAADSTVVLDDTVSSLKKFVVALQTPANTVAGAYAYAGPVPGLKAQGAIAAGQYIRKSATTKAVEDAGVTVGSVTSPPSGAIGFATSAAAGGFVNAFLFFQTAAGSASAGGSYEVRGLQGNNTPATPNTKYDLVSADLVQFRNPSTGAVNVVTSQGLLTCDLGTQGRNGRDQAGALATSAFIHLYYTWDGATVASRASNSAPPTGPTLANGETAWAYAGAVFNGAGPVLTKTRMRGADMFYEARQNVFDATVTAGSESTITYTGAVPANALSFRTFHCVNATAASEPIKVRLITTVDWVNCGNQNATAVPMFELTIPYLGGTFFVTLTTTNRNWRIDVQSYRVPNGGE